MVAQEAGIPLLLPMSKNKYDENSSFLSGCYTLGEILEKQGYQNRILMGSDANFGCTSNFYKSVFSSLNKFVPNPRCSPLILTPRLARIVG